MEQCNWLDTRNKRGCKSRGINVERVEQYLIKQKLGAHFLNPVGVAMKKTFGNSISEKELIQLPNNLNKINNNILKQLNAKGKNYK